ncbi:hypothetical protein SK128_005637, partial [Halocaridina rubra]
MQIVIHFPLWAWLRDKGSTERDPLLSEEAPRTSPSVYHPDHHDNCPFDYLLTFKPSASSSSSSPSTALCLQESEMVQRSSSKESPVRRYRNDISRGSSKTVRFADNSREGNVGGGYDPSLSTSTLNGRENINAVVKRERFYKRSDGRFILKEQRPLDIPGVYGPIPYPRPQNIRPQDIIRNIRYPDVSALWENHENCPFREILRIRPSETPPPKISSPKKSTAQDKANRRTTSQTRRSNNRQGITVKGVGASGEGWNTVNKKSNALPTSSERSRSRKGAEVEEDLSMWRKWSPAKDSFLKGLGRGRPHSVSFADLPPPVPRSRPRSSYRYGEHGAGCKYAEFGASCKYAEFGANCKYGEHGVGC